MLAHEVFAEDERPIIAVRMGAIVIILWYYESLSVLFS